MQWYHQQYFLMPFRNLIEPASLSIIEPVKKNAWQE